MVAETDAPPIPARRINGSIPLRVMTAVRTLYLVQGHTPKEIEVMGLGVTAQQVSNMANREGWSRQRREVTAKVEQTVAVRTEKAAQDVADALAVESEELCFKALEITRQGLAAGGMNGAKQAQAGSSTLKNLYSVVQVIRKPAEAGQDSGSRMELNLFFMGMQASAPTEPKQVHELKPV